MPSSKTVSVVIPAYNREKYIASAVDSVLAQTLPSGWGLEVIVVDDGSTDKTVDVLKTYGKKITLLKIKHSGKPAVARNAGLAVAKGDLVAFQDSDDLWKPNKLATQLPVFDDPKIVLSFGQAEVMDQSGATTGGLVVDKKALISTLKFSDLLKQNTVSTLTAIARRDAVLAVGGFNEIDELRAVEDYHLWLKLAAKYPGGLKPLADTLAIYRVHDLNISKATNAGALRKLLAVFNSLATAGLLNEKQLALLEETVVTTEENWARQTNIDAGSPAITVLMSVYNGERFLKPAVESILNQTFTDFEFLVINDGSKDKTQQIIENYQKKDSRIRLINQVNHGFIYSLNKGVRIARGQFIARMDADDISLPKRFAEQMKMFKQNPRLGAVSTYFELINFEDGKPLGKTQAFPTKSLDIKRALYVVNPMAHGATTFRKQAYMEVGPYTKEYAPAEDYDMWRRISKDWDLGIVPKVLFQYRINNPNSMSQANTAVQENNANRVRRELIDGPLIAKGYREIVDDYNAIGSEVYGKHAQAARNEYLNEQLSIADSFLTSNSPQKALPTTLAVIKLQPSYASYLLKKYPKCLYINLARRLKLK